MFFSKSSSKVIKRGKTIVDRVNSFYPTQKLKNIKKEYKDEVFLIELPEGGDADFLNIVVFSAWACDSRIKARLPIRFYAKIIGFEDTRALIRDWGFNFSDFKELWIKRFKENFKICIR